MARTKWDEQMIEKELFACINALDIRRMPTASELVSLGRNDLHIQVGRTKTYRGWAEHLGLEMKTSSTLEGQINEDVVEVMLKDRGYTVENMSTKFPYDLLVNGAVKIDVKIANPFYVRGSRVHTFGINKKNPTCDIYICLAFDEEKEVEKLLIIPSHKLRIKTLCIGKESKYDQYKDDWGLIDEYNKFMSRIQ